MAKIECRISNFKKNEENPFMKQAIEEVERHIVKKYKNSTHAAREQRALVAAADLDTGEVFKTSFIRQVEVDEDQFVKLYLNHFGAFFDLSKSAIRVFGYFMQAMKPKNDMVLFLLDDCMEYTGYKAKETIYRGLAELVAAEVIARGPADNLWFINPLIVFNGDRVSFTKTFIKKKELVSKKKFKEEYEKTLPLFSDEEQHSIE